MYCGNNRNHPSIKKQKIGNRYSCLKKGIGVGKSLPYDKLYLILYKPIDKRKIYCGLSNKLPKQYDLFGSNQMCFQIGVGVGRRIKAKKGLKK